METKTILLPVHVFFPTHYFGTETYTLELASKLKELGHRPVILTATPFGEKGSGKLIDTYEFAGLPVYVMDLNLMPPQRFKDTYYRPELVPVLENLIRRIQPDLIHVTHLINHSAALLEAINNTGIPAMATLTDFFGFCFNNKLERHDGSLCTGPDKHSSNCLRCYMTVAQAYPFSEKIKARINDRFLIHALSRALPFLVDMPGVRGRAAAAHVREVTRRAGLLRQFYGGYRFMVAPSEFLYEAYRENRFYPERLKKINFGINLEAVKNHREPKKKTDDIVRFGYIGQIMHHKGVDLLLDAFLRIGEKNKTLDIYGPGDQDPSYMQGLNRMAQGNECVRFNGTFPREALVDTLSRMDVLVIPSRWYENSPLVLLYALAARTPVIVTDVKGMTEFVRNGINGFAFEMNNAAHLSSIMREMVRDPSKVETMSLNARYDNDVEDHAKQVIDLYEQMGTT